MIRLERDELVFSFRKVHRDATCRIEFMRTLRIPDDNRAHSLPPGLGTFPIERVGPHAARLPPRWRQRGGYLLPMRQAEAMWLNFSTSISAYPCAIKVAAGNINAVTGEPWQEGLSRDRQDYLVTTEQPWLDGFCVSAGSVRQFVAMPLGRGYSAEEQLTGSHDVGGIQLVVYPMKRDAHERFFPPKALCRRSMSLEQMLRSVPFPRDEPPMEMGLAPGGLMHQQVFADKYGVDAWDQAVGNRCVVHLLNSAQWTAVTGKPVPGAPLTAAEYTAAGLPWFSYYDDSLASLPGAAPLAGLDSVAAKGIKLGEEPLPENEAVSPMIVVPLAPISHKHGGKP